MLLLRAPFISQLLVNKSRFVTSVGSAATAADASSFLAQVHDVDASHNCWAYRLGNGATRSSDDGEPRGTAGRAISAAIASAGVQQVVVVVTRYFGGVKLGASRLTRAYGTAASQCLRAAPKMNAAPAVMLALQVEWSGVGALQTAVERCERVDTEFSDRGCVVTIRVRMDREKEVSQRIVDACGGCVQVERVCGDDVLYVFEDAHELNKNNKTE